MNDKRFPRPEDIQREFEDFIQKKFGNSVQILTHGMPLNNKPRTAKRPEAAAEVKQELDLSFDLKPKDIVAYLDRFVVGQTEAKKALAIAVCDHYNQVHAYRQAKDKQAFDAYGKQNVLILGPTGVGKTYMIKQIAKLIGVPFVKADATRFSETGYMGANVDDLIKDLVNQANGSIEQAQFGIVYLDEADKLASPSQHVGRDVSGRGVQLGLLKLMEETDVDLRSGHDPASQMQAFMEMQQKGRVEKQVINTRHILFIVSGAFTGLEDIIARRMNRAAIGFSQDAGKDKALKLTKSAYLHQASTEDFVSYGFEPEFIGRLPVRVACDPLDSTKLYGILKDAESSIISQYKQAMRAYGIELSFTDDALRAIAEQAAQEKTGARALMTVCERLLRSFKYELPSLDVMELSIDADVVANPEASLARIVAQASESSRAELKQIAAFEDEFAQNHKMNIKFNQEACRLLCQKAQARRLPVSEICHELLQSYEHGLKLIQQNTGQSDFSLGRAVVENPKQELERMVKESYNWAGSSS